MNLLQTSYPAVPCKSEKLGLLALQAVKEEEALEAKRQQSRIELEAAMRERRAREEATKRREARKVAERDERATQVQQRMQELQASWADNKAHNEVCQLPCTQSLSRLCGQSLPSQRCMQFGMKSRHTCQVDSLCNAAAEQSSVC